jgi:hypothetical protein
MKEKMIKIKKNRNMRHNPKNIPIFENIFETEFSSIPKESEPILEKPILQYNPIKAETPKRKGESRWISSRSSVMENSKELLTRRTGGSGMNGSAVPSAEANVVEGMTSLNLELKEDDFTNLYNKIKKQNGSKPKTSDTLNLEKASQSISSKAETLNSGASDFWFPNSSIADLPNHTKENDKSVVDSTQLLGIAQAKASSITQRASGVSDNTDQLSSSIASLKSTIANKKLVDPNAAIPEETPESKEQSKIEVKGLGDQLKKGISKGVSDMKFILQTVFRFIGEEIRLAGESFFYFISRLRDSISYFVIIVANALTNNNATISEVKTFYSEIVNFTTVLFTYVFLYNWYYYLFYLNPENNVGARIDSDLFNFFKWYKTENENGNSPALYTFFGPSYMPTALLDAALIKVSDYIYKSVTSKPLIFFILAIIFFSLVLGDLQSSVISGFVNAITFQRTASVLSIIVFLLTMGFAFHWIYKLNIWQSAVKISGLPAIGAILGCLVATVLYLIYIVFFGLPLGMLFITFYVLVISFFAIVIFSWYNNGVGGGETGGILGTIQKIYDEVTKKSEGGGDSGGGEGGSFSEKAMRFAKNAIAFIEKWASDINKYLMEIFIILILFSGINTYTSNYGAIVFEKSDSQNVNNIGSPISSAFKHLFTWLIIINALIIMFVGVRMWGKYYKLKEESQGGE